MRRRVAPVLSLLTALAALVAFTVVSATSAAAATMCPYTVSQYTNTYTEPHAGATSKTHLNAGSVYYVSQPPVTSNGWIKYRTQQWVEPGKLHRTGGSCLN